MLQHLEVGQVRTEFCPFQPEQYLHVWTALHEKVKDDGTAEDGLQDFAGGQYHRAKLATEISSHPPGFFRGILGAPRGKPARKADIVVQKTRGGRLAAGRGGGVMGTRGRGGLTRPRGFFTPPPSPRTLEEFKVLVNSPPSIRKSPPSGPEPNVAPPGRRILNGKIIRPPSTPSVGSSDGHSKSNKTRVVRRQPRYVLFQTIHTHVTYGIKAKSVCGSAGYSC